MGQAARRRPDTMPTEAAVAKASTGLQIPLIMTGSRAEKRVLLPDFTLHGEFRVAGGDLATLKNKHVLIFVHGYNITRHEALQSTADFYHKIQQALTDDQVDLDHYGYLGFTWPGDVGPLFFNDAQIFAQHSGVALYKLVRALYEEHEVQAVTLITHSLGAHVGLRSAAILGERAFHDKANVRYQSVMLLAPAVENDVFRRPLTGEEYHFPESAFGIRHLHIFMSRADLVLKQAFSLSEFAAALGYAGPESMSPLQSLSRRVKEVLGETEDFGFELHDFSPTSTVIMNPRLHAHSHSDYWTRPEQADYYINMFS